MDHPGFPQCVEHNNNNNNNMCNEGAISTFLLHTAMLGIPDIFHAMVI